MARPHAKRLMTSPITGRALPLRGLLAVDRRGGGRIRPEGAVKVPGAAIAEQLQSQYAVGSTPAALTVGHDFLVRRQALGVEQAPHLVGRFEQAGSGVHQLS